jgi:hypothetical protein
VAAVVVTGCSSSGGKQKEAPKASEAGVGVADTPRLTIAMITHETPGDTFWDKIKAGAQAAAKKDNVTLKYSNDPQPDKQAVLIQNAVDSKVDGIASTLVTPDALADAVHSATKAGIPVVGFNSGIDQYKELGALMYFGSDETIAGTSAGKRIADAGGKHPLCPRGSLRRRQEDVTRNGEHQRQRRRPVSGHLDADGEAAAGQVDRLRRHSRCADRAGRSRLDRAGQQLGQGRHLRPERRRRQGDQGREDRVLDRPAAVRPGLRGRRLAVAVPHQPQRHRRW